MALEKRLELLRAGGIVTGGGNRPGLNKALGQLRPVPLDGGFIQSARALGVCLGD